MKKWICIAIVMLSLCLVSCGDTTGNPPGTTEDEMFSDFRNNVQLEVYKQDGHVYTAEYDYEIPELAGYDELEDGKHYRLTADVTFLNGGVAGYVDYPQIDRVISIEEISSDGQNGIAAEKNLTLSIDGKKIDVAWEDNESVTALKELVAEKALEIQMSKYGGFEQVGPLGAELPADDEEMTTEAGDIVLYSGNQIVVFYGSNTWDYTKLGHINGSTAEELEQMLSEKDVTLTLEEE